MKHLKNRLLGKLHVWNDGNKVKFFQIININCEVEIAMFLYYSDDSGLLFAKVL